MAQSWPSQDGDDPEDIDAWMPRRNAQVALRPEADAAGRDLWNQTIQTGDDLYAGNPSDITAIGLAALVGAAPNLTPASSDDQDARGGGFQRGPALSAVPVATPTSNTDYPSVSELDVVGRLPDQTPHPSFLDGLNHSWPARIAGGVAGYAVGLPFGVGRAGWHAIEGVGDGQKFAAGLFSHEGRARALDDTQTAAHNALQYGRSVLANPSRLANDAATQGAAAVHSVVPFKTPMADTALGEIGHEFGIGMNAGETATNIAGLIATPEVFEGLNAVRTFAATREANIAEMMARGIDEPTAVKLSRRYDGQGDHAVIQKRQKSILGFKTPLLKEAPIPQWFMDGPLNVSKPRGLSQYDFYKYHYGVDGQFHGGKLPNGPDGPRGFSGRNLGFERYGQPGRTWARIPQIWKDYYAGVTSGDVMRQLPQDAVETPQ